MPLERYYLLGRGVFEVGKVTVASGQYYQEIPYYGPPRPCEGKALEITKFYEWKIIDCPRVSLLNVWIRQPYRIFSKSTRKGGVGYAPFPWEIRDFRPSEIIPNAIQVEIKREVHTP